ncbi:MAG TPA: 4,5-DOPA dioxygenase extradiol [Anaerolineaceae bacterium]|nr:4,5-DOPA dioxygenase extradiol [Anaerolineaceae bacterium]
MENQRMPVLFVGHGSPMNAIEDNQFSRAWIEAAQKIPHPKAILCISAHWETLGSQVTAMQNPPTIHDFYGFPRPLFEKQYPAPGSPPLAKRVSELITTTNVEMDQSWGLDHGTWSVLCRMFPNADIPVVQLSLDRSQDAAFNYDLGIQLKQLRDEGVLIVGSGNIVHNLRVVVFEDRAYDWAIEFDEKVKHWILAGDHDPLIHYEKLGRSAQLSINSAEHYLPLLYILALQQKDEPVSFFAEKVWGGSLSMRCVRIG